MTLHRGNAVTRKRSRIRNQNNTPSSSPSTSSSSFSSPTNTKQTLLSTTKMYNKRDTCCERLQNYLLRIWYQITFQPDSWKIAKKARKKRARERIRESERLRNAPIVTNGLSYEKVQSIQIDRPVACGNIPILFQSDRLLVVHKPAPMPSQKNALYARSHMRYRLKHQLKLSGRLAALHRLDICTTGVMLWSRDKDATKCFAKKMRDHTVQKIYLSLVRGYFPSEPMVCREDIDGKESLTTFYRLTTDDLTSKANKLEMKNNRRKGTSSQISTTTKYNNKEEDIFSLVCCVPRTGRKHQIRKHLKFLGYPIANDPRYGGWDGAQYNNQDFVRDIYRDKKIVNMFRSAWGTFKNMKNINFDELKQHVDCCDKVAAIDNDGGDGGQDGFPWSMTWLGKFIRFNYL
jgi:23S rRNA-/tRNA-specific pseudouridylate synthase